MKRERVGNAQRCEALTSGRNKRNLLNGARRNGENSVLSERAGLNVGREGMDGFHVFFRRRGVGGFPFPLFLLRAADLKTFRIGDKIKKIRSKMRYR
jgi:hypothetical protein